MQILVCEKTGGFAVKKPIGSPYHSFRSWHENGQNGEPYFGVQIWDVKFWAGDHCTCAGTKRKRPGDFCVFLPDPRMSKASFPALNGGFSANFGMRKIRGICGEKTYRLSIPLLLVVA